MTALARCNRADCPAATRCLRALPKPDRPDDVWFSPEQVWPRCVHFVSKLTATERLDNLMQALVDDVLDAPDDEIEAEIRADGRDPEAEAAKVRAIIDRAIAERRKEKEPPR